MAVEYVAYTVEGQRVAGVLPVDSPAAAEELLLQSDLTIASVRVKRSLRDELRRQLYRQLPTFFRPKAADLVAFTRGLATLLHSGIPLHRSLALLREHTSNPPLKETALRLADEIAAGTSFSAAVGKHPLIFPTFYSRLLLVGEEAGNLEQVLRLIADYLERQAVLRQRVTSAVRYPAIVMLVGAGSVFFLVTNALPALANLIREFGGELPTTAKILFGISDFLNSSGQWLLLGLGGLVVALALGTRTETGSRYKDAFLLRLPIIGRLIRLISMARTTSSLAVMLRAGLPLVDALELTSRVLGNFSLQRALSQVRTALLEGRAFSQALSSQPLFPGLVPQMVEVGEQAGTLVNNLETLAQVFGEETDRAITGLTSMIEPVMMLVLGGIVGFVAVTVMSTLYGALGQIR